jgi:hypothetical protein
MGFAGVFLTLATVTACCLYILLTDNDRDCSVMQWELVTATDLTHSNGLLMSSSSLLLFRRLALYIVLATVLYIVADPGE